jgi:hypothetical protein
MVGVVEAVSWCSGVNLRGFFQGLGKRRWRYATPCLAVVCGCCMVGLVVRADCAVGIGVSYLT